MGTPYRFLAQYYDALFQPFRSPIDVAREHVLKHILPRIKTACDLACGTGTTAVMLAQRGIRVYGVDLSSKMCQITREKARREHLSVRVLQADMRTFRLPEPVDLILSEYDAVNHVPHKSDLRKVAGAASRALRPGGYFYFDVNNARGFKKYWTGTFWIEKPNLLVSMRNGHRPQLDRAWTDIDLFVREGTRWQRHHERVEEVCWDSAEVRRILGEAGFNRLRAWDAAPFWKNQTWGRGCRTIYLAHKTA